MRLILTDEILKLENINITEKVVFSFLLPLLKANKNLEISNNDIANKLYISSTTVQKAITSLKNSGYIYSETKPLGVGKGSVRILSLNPIEIIKGNAYRDGELNKVLDASILSDKVKKYIIKYINYRKEIKKPLTIIGLELLLEDILTLDDQIVINAIDKTIKNTWLNLYFDTPTTQNNNKVSSVAVNYNNLSNEVF